MPSLSDATTHDAGAPGGEITSTRNPRVQALASLRRARERRATGRHLAEGPHVVAEALRAGVVVELLGTVEALARLRDEVAVPAEVPVTVLAPHVLERLTEVTTPQGVLALVGEPTVGLDTVVGRGLLVVLHEVADPGNVGTIVRTADAAGAAGVVCTVGGADVLSPKAVRAAAGSTYHLPLVTGVTTAEVVAACRAAGQAVLGLDGGAQDSVLAYEPATAAVALVLGNEAHGLPPAVAEQLDGLVAVPLRGRAESLNVAAAAAVAIYAVGERLRAQP